MNILHIVNFFNGGGSTRACYEIAANNKSNNHFFVGSDGGMAEDWFKKIGPTYLLQRDPNFNYDVKQISDIAKERSIDLIHMYVPGAENVHFLRNYDLPKVVTILCDQRIGFDPSIFNHIIFPSYYGQSLSSDLLEGHSNSVIRYGIGSIEDKFDNTENDLPVFGRVSAICKTKKILDTIICAQAMPEYRFIIAGHVLDPVYDNLIRYFIALNDIKNVDYSTNISEEDKERVYSQIDVLHYPTSQENFCISILEAMQRSKAVISYHDAAVPELNPKYNLALVPPGDIFELIKISKKYAENKPKILQDGSLNRIVYEQAYAADRYSKEIGSTYDKFV